VTIDENLAVLAIPGEYQGDRGIREKSETLPGAVVGVEVEPVLIDTPEKHRPRGGFAIGINRGENHGVRLINLCLVSFLYPHAKLLNRIGQKRTLFEGERAIILALSERICRHREPPSLWWT
jgi:hypothetical protein